MRPLPILKSCPSRVSRRRSGSRIELAPIVGIDPRLARPSMALRLLGRESPGIDPPPMERRRPPVPQELPDMAWRMNAAGRPAEDRRGRPKPSSDVDVLVLGAN